MTTERKEIVFVPTKLEEKWIDENVRNDYKNKIAYLEGWLNNQFREAIEKEGLKFDLPLIKEVRESDTSIHDIMYLKYKEYEKKHSYIPKAEKERVEKSFTDVADKLKNICLDAYYQLEPYNYSISQRKDGSVYFEPSEVNQFVETIGIRIFSVKERKYSDLLDKATKALVEVANFERENGIHDYALAGFAVMPKHNDPFNYIAYPCGLVHDARLGVVNFERIARGVMNQ